MTLLFNDMVKSVKYKLSDPSDVQDEQYWEKAITEALDRYSEEKPLEKVSDISGAGSFDLALPADFYDGFSTIRSVEYPFETTTQVPKLLTAGRDYVPYRSDTGLLLRMLRATPASGETVRLTYTTLHTLTVAATTVPVVDEQAVANLAAAIMCFSLSAEFAKRSRSTMPDTTFDLTSKARDYRDLCQEYLKAWRMLMGISEDGAPGAAVAIGDYDMKLVGGRAPLTHPVSEQ